MPILDLNDFIKDERVIKIKDIEICVTKIPSRLTLKAEKIYPTIDENDPESFDKLVDLVMEIIKTQNDQGITKDWLYDNTDFRQLVELLKFTLAPLNDMIKGKNQNPPRKQKKK